MTRKGSEAMGIKVISGLDPGYWDKDVRDFMSQLERAISNLEILAQIQATAGGLIMAARADDTFENKCRLEIYLAQIQEGQKGTGK